jgi:hypothetical protein
LSLPLLLLPLLPLLPLPLSLSISPSQLSPLPHAVVDCCLLLSAYAVATVAATAATASAAAITTASSVSRRLRRHAALTFRLSGEPHKEILPEEGICKSSGTA